MGDLAPNVIAVIGQLAVPGIAPTGPSTAKSKHPYKCSLALYKKILPRNFAACNFISLRACIVTEHNITTKVLPFQILRPLTFLPEPLSCHDCLRRKAAKQKGGHTAILQKKEAGRQGKRGIHNFDNDQVYGVHNFYPIPV